MQRAVQLVRRELGANPFGRDGDGHVRFRLLRRSEAFLSFVWQLGVVGYQPVYSCVFLLILIMLLTLCKGNVCAAQQNFANADWPGNTLSNTVASGICVVGYTGSPSRTCLHDGQWSTTVSNACTRAS